MRRTVYVSWCCLTLCCLLRGAEGGHRNPGRWREVEVYLTLHCDHQRYSALRWAAIAVNHFSVCSGQSRSYTVPIYKPQRVWRERKTRSRNRTEVLLLTSLAPYRSAKPAYNQCRCCFRALNYIAFFCLFVCLFVPPGTSCGAFIQKHASIITVYLSLTHPYKKYFNSLTEQIIQQQKPAKTNSRQI